MCTYDSFSIVSFNFLFFSFRNCHNLQYLSVAYCKKLTDKGLMYLSGGKGAKRLVYLDMSGCAQVGTETTLSHYPCNILRAPVMWTGHFNS